MRDGYRSANAARKPPGKLCPVERFLPCGAGVERV
jgi:hypothetical protein